MKSVGGGADSSILDRRRPHPIIPPLEVEIPDFEIEVDTVKYSLVEDDEVVQSCPFVGIAACTFLDFHVALQEDFYYTSGCQSH